MSEDKRREQTTITLLATYGDRYPEAIRRAAAQYERMTGKKVTEAPDSLGNDARAIKALEEASWSEWSVKVRDIDAALVDPTTTPGQTTVLHAEKMRLFEERYGNRPILASGVVGNPGATDSLVGAKDAL